MFNTTEQTANQQVARKGKKPKKDRFSQFKEEYKAEQEQNRAANEERIRQDTEKTRAGREQAFQTGIQRGKEFFGEGGLSPEKRRAMQYEAQRGIERNLESANRKLLGEQGRRGVVGRGGVGYAQQRDLHRQAAEMENASIRDLDKLSEDLAMKQLAAIFAGGQGEAALYGLDEQAALDALRAEEENMLANYYARESSRQFNRI